MKKFLLALVVLGGLTLNSFAQKADGGKFSIGVEAGLPVGDVSNVSSFTIGGSLKYEHPIADKTAFTVSGGYTYFPYKSDVKAALKTVFNIDKSGEGFVPLKAGIKYYFNDTFYGEGQIGAVISTESGGGTAFAYSPGVGFKVSDAVDLGIRFEGWTKSGDSINQFGLRLAYSF